MMMGSMIYSQLFSESLQSIVTGSFLVSWYRTRILKPIVIPFKKLWVGEESWKGAPLLASVSVVEFEIQHRTLGRWH